jgi:hypothetical protein
VLAEFAKPEGKILSTCLVNHFFNLSDLDMGTQHQRMNNGETAVTLLALCIGAEVTSNLAADKP